MCWLHDRPSSDGDLCFGSIQPMGSTGFGPRGLASVGVIACHEHDIYSNGSAKIAAIDRAYPQPNRMHGSKAIPVARIRRDLHPQKTTKS
jgi:hypothetical protein